MIESIDTILPAVFVFWALKLTSSLLFVSPIVRYSHIAVDKFAIFFFFNKVSLHSYICKVVTAPIAFFFQLLNTLNTF